MCFNREIRKAYKKWRKLKNKAHKARNLYKGFQGTYHCVSNKRSVPSFSKI